MKHFQAGPGQKGQKTALLNCLLTQKKLKQVYLSHFHDQKSESNAPNFFNVSTGQWIQKEEAGPYEDKITSTKGRIHFLGEGNILGGIGMKNLCQDTTEVP